MKQLILLLLGSSILFSCGSSKTLLSVSSERRNCTGVVPQKCLLIKVDKAPEWGNHYSSIKNFNWEPGYEYVLEVHKEENQRPPADAPSFVYVADKEVSKKYIGYNFDFNGKYVLATLNNDYAEAIFKDQPDKIPFIKIDVSENKISGNAGCNNFFGKFEMDKNVLKCGALGSTRMACPSMEHEAAFLKILSEPVSLEKIDNEVLVWQNGSVVMTFKFVAD